MFATSAMARKPTVYILLDKSNSMWAEEPSTKQRVFFIARQKIYDIISSISFEDRHAAIILFDDRLKKSYRAEIDSIEKAKLFLKDKKPGGGTTIGDRLEEIRLEIMKYGLEDVEIHLFSDLNEEHPGKVPFNTAVNRLNELLNSGKRDNIKWKLFAYTWDTQWQKITPAKIRKKLPLPNVTTLPLNKKQMIVLLEKPDAVVFDLLEEKGKIIDVKQGKVNIKGMLDLKLVNINITMKIEAHLEEAKNVSVLLNGKKEFWVTRRDIDNQGGFNIKNVMLTLDGAVSFLAGLKSTELSHPHTLALKPDLYPKEDKIFKENLVSQPDKVKSPIFFTSSPFLFCDNFPPGTTLFIKNVPAEETVQEPIEIRWNVGAIGKHMDCKTQSSGYFTDENGNVLNSVILDSSMKKNILFHLDKAKPITNSNITFSIKKTSMNITIPLSVEVIKPSVSVTSKINSIIIPTSNQFVDFDEAILFDMNLPGHSFELELILSNCKGTGCDKLDFSIYNPLNPGMEIIPGEPPLKINVSSSLWFNIKAQATSSGKKIVNLICHSKKRQIEKNDKLIDKLSIPLTIESVVPKLTWEIVHQNKPVKLGASQKKLLKFISKGQDVSTNDKDLKKYNFRVNVSLYPKSDALKSTEINLSIESFAKKNKQVVKSVFFNANKTQKCTIGEFLNNPHITLQVDPSKKPFIGTRKERGKILFKLTNNTGNHFDLPTFFYGVDLKP